MKGGVASILAAVKALVDAGVGERLGGEIPLPACRRRRTAGRMLAAIRAGVTGDMAVITEPTGLDVVIAHAGAITFKLTVPGRAACVGASRGRVRARQACPRSALEADETAWNGAETEPLMTAHGLPYATIIGTVHGAAGRRR